MPPVRAPQLDDRAGIAQAGSPARTAAPLRPSSALLPGLAALSQRRRTRQATLPGETRLHPPRPAGAPSAMAHQGPTGGGHSQAAGQSQGRGADPEIKLMAPGLCPLLPKKEPFSWRCSEFRGKPLKQLFDASPVELHLFSVLLGINLQFSASPSLPLSPKRREGEKKKGSALSR